MPDLDLIKQVKQGARDRRGRMRRDHPRRGVHAFADDPELSARHRRERFRKSAASTGGKPGSGPSRPLWAGDPIRQGRGLTHARAETSLP